MELETKTGDRSRPPPPETSPWLVFFAHGRRGRSQTFFSIAQGRKHVRDVPELRKKSCVMVSQYGWLLVKKRTAGGRSCCSLLNPASMEVIRLPPLPPPSAYTSPPYTYRRYRCILSSPPTDPNCVVCFFDKMNTRALFCRLLQKQWIKTEYKLYDDQIRDVVVCNGKVYGITIRCRLVAVDFNPNPTVTLIEEVAVAPTAHVCSCSLRLVESCGELYLVFMVYAVHIRVVHNFAVFKMDFSEMKWVHVDSIGDRAFFLCVHGQSLSCSAATESTGRGRGVQRDSIYYVVRNDPCIYRFDMTDQSITRNHALCGNISSPSYGAYWVLPSSHA